MPEIDTLRSLFGGLAATDLPVPASAGVIARGRRRRRNARLTSAAAALAVMALASSLAASIPQATVHRTGHQASASGKAAHHQMRAMGDQPGRSPSLPPAGSGHLLLGTGLAGSASVFEMSRIGSARAVRVSGLPAVVAPQSVIASSPGGGWVVTEAAGPVSGVNWQPVRLATVSATGAVRPFGPEFSKWENVTSLAVRPDGSAVAVGVLRVSGSRQCLCSAARIELIPMPGHEARVRTWTLASATMTIVKFLSWAPDGLRLTYFPGGDETGGGFATDGAATLDTAGPGDIAPVTRDWPAIRKGSCNAVAGTWNGSSYLALEGCDPSYRLQPVDPVTGSATGPGVTVPLAWACGSFALGPVRGSDEVVVSGCGSFLVSHGHARTLALPAGLTWVSAG